MAKKSLPQIRRELRGIKQAKDPIKAKAGRMGAVVTNAKRAGIPIEQAVKSNHFKQLAKASNQSQAMGGEHAEELYAFEVRLAAKLANKQGVNLQDISILFCDNSQNVSMKLVNMALGEGAFNNAPASVQRLAILNVLNLAGLNKSEIKHLPIEINEKSIEELSELIRQSEALLESMKT